MLEIDGEYAKAKIFTQKLDSSSEGQIRALCNSRASEGQKIRIMPDVHAGAGCVIGFTAVLNGRVVPNMVGVDIGCGMYCVKIGQFTHDFNKLDKVIRMGVPAGKGLHKSPHRFADQARLDKLTVAKAVDNEKGRLSVGSLGGGNHFIELAQSDQDGATWLIIHSGSRNPGLQVATLHQKLAGDSRPDDVPYAFAWLEGAGLDNYLNDMDIMQDYARLNREAIADSIMKGMKWKEEDSFHTIHNYIDIENMIVRKGAVSAQKGERLLVPMNMRDGSVLCEGLGVEDWNFSAPHGAGRLMSRTEAREKLTLTALKKDMEGIYSNAIARNVVDESPGAYKPMDEILEQLGKTAKITAALKPIYNFKAGGK